MTLLTLFHQAPTAVVPPTPGLVGMPHLGMELRNGSSLAMWETFPSQLRMERIDPSLTS